MDGSWSDDEQHLRGDTAVGIAIGTVAPPYYHGGAYYGNSAWHGGYYGSSGSAYGAYGSAHYGEGYNPSTGTYARGASTSTAYGTQKVGQAYNPYTGAYGATHQGSNA